MPRNIRALESSSDTVSTRWWGCQDVADYLHISRREAQRLAQNGHIPSFIIPGMKRLHRRFRREDIEAVMQQQRRSDA